MKINPINISTFVLSMLLLVSCANRKGTVSNGLNYAQKTKFDQLYFSAAKQKVLGNYNEAAKQFAEALKIDPNSHDVMYQMANLNMAVSDFHNAVYWAENSMLANPKFNYWYAGQLAQAYNKVGEFTKSAAIFEVMMDEEPERRRNYEEASRQYVNAGQFKKSIEILEKYVDRFGINEDAARLLESLNFQIGKPKEALAWMKKLVESDPDDIRYQGLLAESYSRDEKWEEAKAIYFRILSKEPQNGYANFGLSEIYQKSNEEDSSFHYLQLAFEDKLVPLEMKLKVVGSFFPHLQSNEKMKEQAIQLTSKLINVHDQEAKAFLAHGDILHASGDLLGARESLLQATKISGSDIGIWRKLLSIDDELDDLEMLKEDSKNALELFPSQPFLYIINSYACFATDQFQEAITVAEEGMDIALLKHDKADLLSTIADASYELKNFDKCFETYDELLEISPKNDGALNNYAYYLSEQNQNLDKALTMINEALQLNPNRPTYIDTKGWVLFKQGKYELALVELEKAYKMIPTDSEVAEHYAQCLIKLDKVTEANEVRESINKN
ncbi:MAG: tetratricopeptide repeat protein [Bacteroidia bacterium]|nr:tetratricopeptide repeat protein [Bacteroidia bacterium]